MVHKPKRRSTPQRGSIVQRDSRDGRIVSHRDLAPRTGVIGTHGGRTSGSILERDVSDRIAEVREGLPLSELTQLAQTLSISHDQLAGILGITVRTLQRKAGADERLGPAASDRLARVKRILELANHVLGDQHRASRWMTSASRPLGGELPLQLLDTDIGTQRVEQELYQIKYGIPA
jgi:putative toxin-antitoxin system antitoxin component (TIGR02293 family)